MSSATEHAHNRSDKRRRSRSATVLVALILFLPALIAAILYSHHRRAERPTDADTEHRAAESRKLTAMADHYLNVTGELDKASETYQQAIASYHRDYRAYLGLGIVYARLGQYAKAAEVTRQAMKLAPNTQNSYENLGSNYVALQHPEDAHEIIREAQANKMDGYAFHKALYALAFLAPLGPDKPAMADQLQWFAVRPEHENAGLALASDTAAYAGHLVQARELTKRAVDSALQHSTAESAAVWQENAAIREAAFGNVAESRRQAEAGLKLAPASPGAQLEAALAFAMIGDSARAESLAKAVDKQLPLDTQIHSLWLPAIRAQLALQRNKPDEALNDVGLALPLELGEIPFASNLSCLYPTYLRGMAYLAANKGTAAATEFQKIIDHSGIVWNCWTGALAHLGMARAHILETQEIDTRDVDDARLRALMAYKDFLKLWKDADPDIPILKQAKEEFANLQ